MERENMVRRGLFLVASLVLIAGWLAGCSLAEQPLTETAPIETSVVENVPLQPGEVIHLEGQGTYISEPFPLEGEGTVEVFWVQDCQVFYLALVNADEALAKGPDGVIIFESAASPTENTETDDFQMQYPYIAGDYVIMIQADGGSWEVWARTEPVMAE
jgi:hypothetical protein